MGDTERPIPERLGDQDEQAAHLGRTGNEPTVDDEQRLLAEVYGAADMAGFHVGPGFADGLAVTGDPDGDRDQDDEPADQGDAAPAADTATGGESA
ncbi:hypothetical protein ACF1BE_19960 [Streptomyces sp. NPDC014991]|uniref:hypothetical protein n=1 Tax=Streptomyces sp. NPDC014991 TaxID=3364935 RepID=UPI003701D3C5